MANFLYSKERIIGIILVVVSLILYFYLIPNFVIASNGYGGDADTMSPQFFPILGSIIIGIGGVGLIVTSFLNQEHKHNYEIDNNELDNGKNHIGPYLVILSFVIFILLFQSIGYIYATPIFIAMSMFIFGYKKILGILITSAIVSLVAYIIFVYGLNLPLE